MSVGFDKDANHFNFIRLFAAFLVFYGHAYVLAGSSVHTYLSHEIGIFIFFAISGYLISMSWDKDPSLIRYFRRRSLRIFPALAVVTILSILVLGPLLTTLSLGEYFSNPHIKNYLSNIVLYISFYLPGVFEHNHVPNAVNGSLWSLPVEFFMYMLVAFVGKISKNSLKYAAAFMFWLFFCVSVFWAKTSQDIIVVYATDIRQVFITGAYFWAGAFMYHWNIRRFFTFEYFVSALLVLVFVYQFAYMYELLKIFLIPFLVLSFGFSDAKALRGFNRFDYSYGFYIYAFPIQQTVIYMYPHISMSLYLASTFILTMAAAALSWHYVEKPALGLKPKRRLSA